jgi:hypothetical protein
MLPSFVFADSKKDDLIRSRRLDCHAIRL